MGKLINLSALILDSNKIKKIENIKTLRKLETLSLNGNLLEDLQIFGTTETMIEVKELFVTRNKIENIKTIYYFPNVIHADQLFS